MRYGFIGLGNMASAIISGMYASGEFASDEIYGYNRSPEKTEKLKKMAELIPCESARDVVANSDVIILAVKPQMMCGVVDDIVPELKEGHTVISIAAGLQTDWYESRLGNIPVVRVMPNINAKVKAAVVGICGGKNATDESVEVARKIFETVGSTYVIEENMFSAFSAIGGASGAFVYLYIDALADAGVKAGFSRKFSVELATKTVLGSAKLVNESDTHPIELVNNVCSPAGTTIEGVLTLKKLGFETAVQQAVEAVIEKDKKLGK